jgi:hypothetical protein
MEGSRAMVILPMFVSSLTSFCSCADVVMVTVPAGVPVVVWGEDWVQPAVIRRAAMRIPIRNTDRCGDIVIKVGLDRK